MHRAGRAKLLLPSFIAVLSACGGTSVGADPEGSLAGAGGSAGKAGSAPIATNPPPPVGSYGGQGGAGGGDGGFAGGGANPPIIEQTCPGKLPGNGDPCGQLGASCAYPAECGDYFVWCDSSGWSVESESNYDGCAGAGPDLPPPPPPPPVGPLACPNVAPPQGAACYLPSTIASYQCNYDSCTGKVLATCNGAWNVSLFAGSGGCGAI